VKQLASRHNNILVVGDDAQSIYSFRAADIGNILNFPKLFPAAKIFKLETNYRSTPDILAVANDIISNNLNQYTKVLRSIQENLIKPRLLPCHSAKQEAEQVVAIIRDKQSAGVSLSQMAVLFRATHHSQFLEMELNRQGIAYDYRGGLRFFERAHIKDLAAYLKLLNNLRDEVSWLRILNLQAGIGAVTAARIITEINLVGKKNFCELADVDLTTKLNEAAGQGWKNLRQTMAALAALPDTNKVATVIQTIIDSGYREYLQAQYPDAWQRLEDLDQLALFAENYDNLKDFVDEMTLQDGFNIRQGKIDYNETDRLVLSTIHQAKGLEWNSVFIINLVENALPNQRALGEAGGLEEERRLFYVAATRAQQYLFLTYPLVSNFSASFNQASQFLLELDQKKLDRGLASESWTDEEMVIEIDENGERHSFLPDLDDL
jgi:DNA helicase-2/ATP-dependent DNA helicase PcrA